MPGLLDLPLELRNQIYSYLIEPNEVSRFGSEPLMPKIHNISPTILRVNKALSYEAGMYFYRNNPAKLWIELDRDKRDVIDITLDTALAALTDESTPASWQCLLTILVSYGDIETEIYQATLILHQSQKKCPGLRGAPEGKEIDQGWRSWFSGGQWNVKGLYNWSPHYGYAPLGAPAKARQSLRTQSWVAGTRIMGDDFVGYLERLVPSPKARTCSGVYEIVSCNGVLAIRKP